MSFVSADLQKEYRRKAGAQVQDEPASKLDVDVQRLLKLICDRQTMKNVVAELGLDMAKVPLGRLTELQIQRGYAAILDIAEALARDAADSELAELSSHFYSIIPHSWPHQSRLEVINTNEALHQKLLLLQTLEEIRLGNDILDQSEHAQSKDQDPRNMLDTHYETIGCDIQPLAKSSPEVALIERYVQQTNNEVKEWRLQTIAVDTVYRLGLKTAQDAVECDNRQLLWHASRLSNFTGILSRGLTIAPPQAPQSGFRLGKGIYFTNALVKAASYCGAVSAKSKQCILLCEVSLGVQQKKLQDDPCHRNESIDAYDSVWGVGRRIPDPSQWTRLDNGTVVPAGPIMLSTESSSAFEHDEFVVS